MAAGRRRTASGLPVLVVARGGEWVVDPAAAVESPAREAACPGAQALDEGQE